MQSKALDKSLKTYPTSKLLSRSFLHSCKKKLKQLGHYNFVDKRKEVKEDKYLFIFVSIKFLVTFSWLFGNVIKIITGQKFDWSFFLEVLLSSG